MGAQELEGGDNLHTLSSDEERAGSSLFFPKSVMSSFVFMVLRVSLFSEHLVDSLPMTVVSSANFMMVFVGWDRVGGGAGPGESQC